MQATTAPWAEPARWTAGDLLTLPDDGWRYELAQGRLVRMAPTSWGHGHATNRLQRALDRYVEERNLGEKAVTSHNGSPLKATTREQAYAALVERAQACRLCPRMEGRRRVLGAGNGALDARVLFVAEAPGRLGGDRTGIPLVSDQSGRNFARLLGGIGWRREDVFVSNAILCNPRDERGRNGTPTRIEVRHCSPHLRDLLATLDPPFVAALGRIALDALALIVPHEVELRRDVATAIPWAGRTLVPLYHPGPRAQLHRPFARQQEDFARLRALVESGDSFDAGRMAPTSSRA